MSINRTPVFFLSSNTPNLRVSTGIKEEKNSQNPGVAPPAGALLFLLAQKE